jgi:hypothetical protein
VIGNRLGLYRALEQGPATPGVLAERTGCHERYLTEWLNNQAAGGYVSYDPETGEFFLSDEQAFCLADPSGPNISAAFLIALGYLRDVLNEHDRDAVHDVVAAFLGAVVAGRRTPLAS